MEQGREGLLIPYPADLQFFADRRAPPTGPSSATPLRKAKPGEVTSRDLPRPVPSFLTRTYRAGATSFHALKPYGSYAPSSRNSMIPCPVPRSPRPSTA